MKVSELIEKLKQEPQDVPVIFNINGMQVGRVFYEEEWCEECKLTHKHVRLGA